MLSNTFFTVNFSFSLLISTITLVTNLIIIFIIYKFRALHTLNNILLCNTHVSVLFYSILILIQSILGFDKYWALNAPFCSFRAYLYNVAITTVCYSKSIHAISRLFFIIFYKHRQLLTRRTHWFLIMFHRIFNIIICIPFFFFNGAYGFESESRVCLMSSKSYVFATFNTIVTCLLPMQIVTVLYIIIIFHIRRSRRRVLVFTINLNRVNNQKREMKILRQMVIQTVALGPSAPIFIFLIICNAMKTYEPPESLYLLSFNCVSIAMFILTIVQFKMSEDIKQIVRRKVFRHY